MSFEFGDTLNWNLVSRLDLEAVKVSANPEIYGTIPSRTLSVDRRILMIGCRSRSAKSRWWLGCRVAQRLMISPSSQSDFVALSETQRFNCGLNTLTLVKFDYDGPYPYLLIIDIPRWITHLYIEVWKYTGPDEGSIQPVE